MYPVHKNETGEFQELARTNDVTFGQLSYLTINPGCERGDHYHKRKEEWFCCIHGECEMELTNVESKATRRIALSSDHKEFIKVEPYENHIVRNNSSSDDCELLIIISEEYVESDPDTFKPNEVVE